MNCALKQSDPSGDQSLYFEDPDHENPPLLRARRQVGSCERTLLNGDRRNSQSPDEFNPPEADTGDWFTRCSQEGREL
jgi:hypothetical protein